MNEKVTRSEYWTKFNSEERYAFRDAKHREVGELIVSEFAKNYPVDWLANLFERDFWFVFEYMNHDYCDRECPTVIEIEEASKKFSSSKSLAKAELILFLNLLDKVKFSINKLEDRERELNCDGSKTKVYESWTKESIISGFECEWYEREDGVASERIELWADDNIFNSNWKCVELIENGEILVN